MIKHRHHKIPKHSGGSDDPLNIVELSVSDHAEAHKNLYEEFGLIEDLLAWKGLAGLINKAELVRELQSLGGKRRIEIHGNPWKTPTITNWKLNSKNLSLSNKAAWSSEARNKRLKTYQYINHQQGEKNSSFGKSVYRNVEGERCKFFRGMQPDGWILSSEWVEKSKNKKNGAYGKKWYNDGKKNFLLSPSDEKVKSTLNLGRLNPGFKKTA